MKCSTHSNRTLTSKCKTCLIYTCQLCKPSHEKSKHYIMTTTQISQQIRDQINVTINQLKQYLQKISENNRYEHGFDIIEACKLEILGYLQQIFNQLKDNYRKIVQNQWKIYNQENINKVTERIQFLQSWDRIIYKQNIKALVFDMESLNQEQLITQQRQEFSIPKICFNQLALRRVSETIAQVIGIQRIPGKKLPPSQHKNMIKFMEGTNILFQYNPESKKVKKSHFREFVVPMRAESINIQNQIYLVGGHNKNKQPSKEIWIYQPNYNIMRVVALMKQGRVGHCLCPYENYLYIFGGTDNSFLQRLNINTKSLEMISDYGSSILGCSGVQCQGSLYFFGGMTKKQSNRFIIKYNIPENSWSEIKCLNPLFCDQIICPIVEKISDKQIIIMGGIKQYRDYYSNNICMLVYNIQCNYFTKIGQGQLIYSIISNGNNTSYRNNEIITLCNLKKSTKYYGPNIPCIISYNLKQDHIEVDSILPL